MSEQSLDISHDESEPKGIRGWLLFPALLMIVNPIYLAFATTAMTQVFYPSNWAALTTPGAPAYDPLWAPLVVIGFILSIAFFIFTLGVSGLFFNKSKYLPKFFIIWLIVSLILALLDRPMASLIPAAASLDRNPYPAIIRSAVMAAIWIPYFLKSQRVKNTFVR